MRSSSCRALRRYPRWTLSKGARLVNELAPVAQALGYALALHGGTLGGSGRDLDVVAFPWGSHVSPRLPEVLGAAMGARVIEWYGRATLLVLPGGRLVDLTVMPAARRLRGGG